MLAVKTESRCDVKSRSADFLALGGSSHIGSCYGASNWQGNTLGALSSRVARTAVQCMCSTSCGEAAWPGAAGVDLPERSRRSDRIRTPNPEACPTRPRGCDRLELWLTDARASQVPELRSFATTLARDQDALLAALELLYSNGPVEGQITKLKLLKRKDMDEQSLIFYANVPPCGLDVLLQHGSHRRASKMGSLQFICRCLFPISQRGTDCGDTRSCMLSRKGGRHRC